MEKIKESELIINPDGSVYHLNIKPENIANDIIFVEDQFRVEAITKYFDSIEFTTQKREFKTQTGKIQDSYADKTCEAGIKRLLPYGN